MTLTPPPFDPELAAVLEMIKETLPPKLTMDEIEATRNGPGIEMLADMDLTLGGAFEVEDRIVPGPENAPDISLLICRPVAPATDGPLPVIYHVHGGGMVLGNNRVGVDARCAGPRSWARSWCPWSTAWHRRTRTPRRSTTSTPGCCGPPTTPRRSAPTPSGSSSRGPARAVVWRPRWHCSSGTARVRSLSASC